MLWRDKEIVNISRDFLNTNGAHQEMNAFVSMPSSEDYFKRNLDKSELREKWLEILGDLNVCSQKGLVEMFDSSIGAASVYMPYGGKYQLTPTQTMIAKLPVLKGTTDVVTMMSYGFDPYLSSWSPYHGAIYAIINSVAKIVSAGGDYTKIRFTFQEYFKRLGNDKTRWGEPLSALLGAYDAQIKLGLPSIGGKDSMSGTFNDIDVVPTLVSFAVNTASYKNVITPELKEAENILVKFSIERDKYSLPVYEQLKKQYKNIESLIKEKVIASAYAIEYGGIIEAVSKMAFGNKLGVELNDINIVSDYVQADYGSIIAEIKKDQISRLEDIEGLSYMVIGKVINDEKFICGNTSITIEEALNVYNKPLEKVFPTRSNVEEKEIKANLFDSKKIYVSKNKVAKPTVFIPVFPGTNCEYDTLRAFEKAGANVITRVFKNLSADNIRETVEIFEKDLNNSQILMFSGGFSAGDEPDGSGKFIATAFRNEKLKEAVNNLLNQRDGLVLGICNGFQALIKLGLVPYGKITPLKDDSPTLTTNNIGRHISKMVYTKVVTNNSPWLLKTELGGVYAIPASHGEGRFVASDKWINELAKNGQIATQYVDLNGNPTMDEDFNPNGSYHAIEGITSPDGRVLGKMAHSERIGDAVALNIIGNQNQYIFESGIEYFK